MKFFNFFCIIFSMFFFCHWGAPTTAMAHLLPIYPGDTIILMELERGIPAHPEVENMQILFHYASKETVEVIEVGGYKKRWIHVRGKDGKQGWIVKKYVDKVIPGPRGMKEGDTASPVRENK